jgi:hypothetical protein
VDEDPRHHQHHPKAPWPVRGIHFRRDTLLPQLLAARA